MQSDSSVLDEGLTYAQVAALVGLQRRSIHRLASQGKFPQPVKTGERRVVFMRSEVEQFIRDRRAK